MSQPTDVPEVQFDLSRLQQTASIAVDNKVAAELLWQMLEELQNSDLPWQMIWIDHFREDPAKLQLHVMVGEHSIDLQWPVIKNSTDNERISAFITKILHRLISTVFPNAWLTTPEELDAGLRQLLSLITCRGGWQGRIRQFGEANLDHDLLHQLSLLCGYLSEVKSAHTQYEHISAYWELSQKESTPLLVYYEMVAKSIRKTVVGVDEKLLHKWRAQVVLLAFELYVLEHCRTRQFDEKFPERVQSAMRSCGADRDTAELLVWRYIQQVIGAVWEERPATSTSLKVPHQLNELKYYGAQVPFYNNDPTFLVAQAREEWYNGWFVKMLVRGDFAQAIEILAHCGEDLRLMGSVIYPYQSAFKYLAKADIVARAFKICWDNKEYGRAAGLAEAYPGYAASVSVAREELQLIYGDVEIPFGKLDEQYQVWCKRVDEVHAKAVEHKQRITLLYDYYVLHN